MAEQPEDLATSDSTKDAMMDQPSALSAEALLRRLKGWYRLDDAHSREWRAEARRNYDFVAGDQWSPEDRRALEEQQRQPITFNRVGVMVDAVCGMEINSRHETVYLPRGMAPGEVKANELLTGASQWMADGCDAEDHQSEAFRDAVITGMGWTEQVIEHVESPQGKYVERRIDPLEMRWDYRAREKNLADARRIWRVRKYPLDEAQERFRRPDGRPFEPHELDAEWADPLDSDGELKSREQKRLRESNAEQHDPGAEVTVVQVQWWEYADYMLVAIPQMGPEPLELTVEQFGKLKQTADAAGIQYMAEPMKRKVFKQALLGSVILKMGPAPCPDHFTLNCITGKLHHTKGTWYGLVAALRDPQMWQNKWLTQGLHILNTTAKGGIIAERGAFEDDRQAERSYARPDAITWAKDGSLKAGKIMAKPGGSLPTGYLQMLEYAIVALRDVTGINLELMGLRDANQPGILEAQRKQAGMTILGVLFDSLRRFRKMVGRVRLYMIQHYIPEGTLIRIADEDGAKIVPVVKSQIDGDYDVIVDDAPTSPNQKEQAWLAIQGVLPAFRGMLTPEAAVILLEYSPVPSKVVDALKALLAKPNPDAEMQRRLASASAAAKIARDQAAADKDRAAAAATRVDAVLDLAQAGVMVQQQEAAALKERALAAGAVREAMQPEMPAEAARMAAEGQLPLPPLPPDLPVAGAQTATPVNPAVIADVLARMRGQPPAPTANPNGAPT
ncbi:MAG TPA: hypothetical protein VNK52_16115 [Hyphomicrobiaceae bacterium]|nr:hypothetical protein [Hyphomicrobiaceae bacterium]